jgi:outer membrane biosynthesis protein TonB
MATSQRGRKPESVQFWLAIAALSLAFHSLFLFGLQRWAKVAVLQPEVGGPIDVELRDAAPAKPDVNEGAIAQVPEQPEVVPQTKLEVKPQPVEPEPEVVQKPDPKPEPKREPELPIVDPKKNVTPSPKVRSSPPARSTVTPKPTSTQTPGVVPPIPKDLIDLNGEGKTRSLTASIGTNEASQVSTGGTNEQVAKLVLQKPLPPIMMSADFVKDVAKSMLVSVTFTVDCKLSQGLVCPSDQINISYSAHQADVVIAQDEHDTELERKIKNWIEKEVKASSLVYQPDPLGKTDFVKKPVTYWNIQVTLKLKN